MLRKERKKALVECDQSYAQVQVKEILDGVFEQSAIPLESVPELLKKNDIEGALNLIEKNHTRDAITLMQRYRNGLDKQRTGAFTWGTMAIRMRPDNKHNFRYRL